MLFSSIGNLDAVNWIVDNSLGMTNFFEYDNNNQR